MLVSRLALSVALVSAIMPNAVAAQENGLEPVEPVPLNEDQEILVTGSRIGRRDATSQTPIVTVSQEAIASRGSPNLETTLNQLPQFTPSAGAGSSFNSRGGQANLNLRALGSQRTLVLIDGRRLQPANADGSADLNILPPALIESVETITGGASAVYGSDAIAGVVNVKLRRRLKGIELAGQVGITDEGDGGMRELSFAAGTDFAAGSGNIMLAGVYSARDAVSFRARDYLNDQALSANIPNGILPVNTANPYSQAAVNAIFARYGALPGSVGRNTQFSFNDDGTVFRQNTLLGYNGNTTGAYAAYNNVLYADTGFFNLAQVPLERYSAFGRVEFEAGSDVKLFAEGLYTHYIARTEGPPPNSSTVTNSLVVPVTNPFIPSDLSALLASRPAPGAPFVIGKRFDVLGPRTESDRYDVFQATIGSDGKLGLGDLTFSIYGTIGETNYKATQINYPSISAVQSLLSASDGGASLCAGGFNPFGNQTISQDCRAYIARDASNRTTLRQAVVEGTLTGGLFNLPGGQARFALGADYRRTTYAFKPDPLIAAGDLANFLPTQASGGKVAVKEVYGELLLPLLADLPLARSLNISLGYRYSDYNVSGGVSTYKADLDWKPFDFLMVRGGYARAIRAPSPADLYTATTVEFVSLGTLGPVPGNDPCDIRSGYRAASYAGAAQVRTLCLAQGVPAPLIDSYINTSSRARTISNGNLNLQPEVADTYSVGVVLSGDFLGTLFSRATLSVDYYNIRIDSAIGNITAPLAVSRCFNADGSNPTYDPTNLFCSLIRREAGRGLIGDITTPRLNLGGYRTSGIDIAASLPIALADLGIAPAGTMTLSADISYLDSFKIKTLPDTPFLDYAGTILNTQVDLFSSARPKWKATSAIRYDSDTFSAGVRWRYMGPMRNANGVGVAGAVLPGTASISYFDLDLGLRIGDKFEIRGGVGNLGDRKPPITVPVPVGSYTTEVNTYDIVGRRFFIGFKARM